MKYFSRQPVTQLATMKLLTDIHTIWWREIKKTLADPAHLALMVVRPLLVIFLIGSGLNQLVTIPGSQSGTGYVGFFGSGFIAVAAIALSMQVGISLIRDYDGSVRAMLVSPLSRGAILAGKIIGELSEQVLTLFVALVIVLLILKVPLSGVLLVIPVLALIVVCFASLGIISSLIFRSAKSYSTFATFILGPLVVLSGAFFPLEVLPRGLKIISLINPLTYGVDGMRAALYGTAHWSLAMDLAILSLFAVGLFAGAWWAFGRQEIRS